MNENSEIQKLLHKFILNECSPEETIEVITYCSNNELTDDFPTVEAVKLLLNNSVPQLDETSADKIFSAILQNANETKVVTIETNTIPYRSYLTIAASILILVSVGLFSYQNDFFKKKNESVILTGDEITLQLENGDLQIISEGKTIQVTDSEGNVIGNQNGNKIAYDTKTTLEKLVYNTIKIPYGKRFELQLSDGTTVHLNSGTTLKYPVKFIAGQNRQVFLDGEAFFEVAKDKKHPFLVNADKLNIRVLGTHFNVSNYPEDELTEVVLVEGSVGMYAANEKFDADKNTILKPGNKGSFDKNNNHIDTKAVITDFYTSWMEGRLTFRNMNFKDITKKLERHYDVTIVNQNTKLANEKFYASFSDEPIEKVLSYFNEVHGINYTIKNNQILIKNQ